ncbi:unnamed protein product [Thelazia callipaeda]|uniref:Uncharacterized protein n=1 Tax=Thelazia callipaeda TaxID=103827 RepID=A0A0N5D6H9_THECL|nr:unnamed protein product [Thelazia callipaeda]
MVGNNSASSCDNNCNGIDSQPRQNDASGSSTREHSSRPVGQLFNGWKQVAERTSTSQPTSKKRIEVTDHNDNAYAIPCCSTSKQRRKLRNKGRK